MDCFITRTGSFLPGEPVGNANIERYLGSLDGESEVKSRVLAMNGIRQRHYALDSNQSPTHDVYELAAKAIERCFRDQPFHGTIDYLSAGSTYSPLSGPGISSILHGLLARQNILSGPLEINSNSGICTSSASALNNAYRAIRLGDHKSAICVGTEQPSVILKSSAIRPEDDRLEMSGNLTRSKWYMSVFLRFMLSDGAGAFLLQDRPSESGLSFKINWSFARSYANEAPLCMKLENQNTLLSQDVRVLSKYLFSCARKFVGAALEQQNESLESYDVILPHLSSFFFQRKMEGVMREFTHQSARPVPYWTNLATTGNTGAASIFVMLDHYTSEKLPVDGQRILLFVPESGQFNFVMFSLTVVRT